MIKHNEDACGIYAIVNITNNKFYIGSSKSIYYRTRRHLSDLRKDRHKNPILQNSFNKYGDESFKWVIIDICTENELQNLEKYYIDILKPIFNIQKNPIRQPKTKEMKKKISKSLKNGYKNGTILPTRTREVVAYSHTGEIFHFNQVKECVKELNLSTTRVYAVLNNEQIHTKGYQIFYKDEKEHNLVKLNLQIGNSGYLERDIQTRYQKPVARLKSCELGKS